jgi:hypothetical protein
MKYIMGVAYVYVQHITAHVHVRKYIYIFNAPETDSAYIHARIYITVYHLLFDFTKPYSGRPPHRANIGQA